jgi:hypothetical protein
LVKSNASEYSSFVPLLLNKAFQFCLDNLESFVLGVTLLHEFLLLVHKNTRRMRETELASILDGEGSRYRHVLHLGVLLVKLLKKLHLIVHVAIRWFSEVPH